MPYAMASRAVGNYQNDEIIPSLTSMLLRLLPICRHHPHPWQPWYYAAAFNESGGTPPTRAEVFSSARRRKKNHGLKGSKNVSTQTYRIWE